MILAKYIEQPIESNVLHDTQLIELQNYLCKFSREDCSPNLYQAWKILILGTSEYKNNQDVILESAWKRYCGMVRHYGNKPKFKYAHELKEGDVIINDKNGYAIHSNLLLITGIINLGEEIKLLVQNFKKQNSVINLHPKDTLMLK